MYNVVLEQIHKFLGNIMRIFNIFQTYVDKNDPWTGIISAVAFEICSTTNRQKCHSTGQLIFGRDMIPLIKHTVDWELIHQKKQIQINKDNIYKNRHIIDHEYKVGDNVMLINLSAYKYGTPYKGPFVITQCFTNVTINLQCVAVNNWYNIHRIKPYKSDTKVECFSSKNMSYDVNI